MWTLLLPGLEYTELTLPTSDFSDSTARVVRVDPERFEVRLVMASAGDGRTRPIPEWREATGAVAAMNAGMYETDYRTSTGAMWGAGHVNNAHVNGYKSVFALDPVDPTGPFARRYDLACGDTIEAAQTAYRSGVQSLRMIGCARKNAWGTSTKRWSSVAVGLDGTGHVLFVHTRSPYTMHDLIDALLAAPLDLIALQYAEGGPEATLSVDAGSLDATFVGSYETGFFESDQNTAAWTVPNALVVVPRAARAGANVPEP